jgi:hypothetical protein
MHLNKLENTKDMSADAKKYEILKNELRCIE